jgi:hypothetical protein
MLDPALQSVLANAALPQKIVLVILLAAIPLTLLATLLAFRDAVRTNVWRFVVANMGVAGPALGLLVGGLNSFHMAETIQRLPSEPTLKQIAPGIFEVSTFVGLGAFVGLLALVAHALICLTSPRQRSL